MRWSSAGQGCCGVGTQGGEIEVGSDRDQVERGVEAFVGQPHLGGVRPLVGDPDGVDRGHQNALGEHVINKVAGGFRW